MSFFEFNITNIPDGERITSVGFESDERIFIYDAPIDLSTGEIIENSGYTTSTLEAEVLNQSGTSASFLFEMLPNDLRGEEFVINIITNKHKYSVNAVGGLNFISNQIVTCEGMDVISLTSDDVVVDGAQEFMLSDFANYFVPHIGVNQWIINDTEATTNDFIGLRSAIDILDESAREIQLLFPNMIVVPENALDFKYSSHRNSKALVAVSAPKVTVIGDQAFSGCEGIDSIHFPLAEYIYLGAFGDCVSLKNVDFPQAKSIGQAAFSGCISLVSVSFPNVTTVTHYAFSSCTSLLSIQLPKATWISHSVFSRCHSLATVSIPSAKRVEYQAFAACSSLVSLELSTNAKLEHLGRNVFSKGIAIYYDEDRSFRTKEITLTLGSMNKGSVDGNILAVECKHYDPWGGSGTTSAMPYTFKEIILVE